MKEPVFSIITVCLNSERTISRTFESILKQSYIDYEYIVLDGGSNDGTVDIIKKYAEKFKSKGIEFSWKSGRDGGIYPAMNMGIDLAQGQLIGILNSDDYYEVDTLSLVKQAAECHPTADVYHGVMRYMENSSITMIHGMCSKGLQNGMIEHPTCFVRKKTYLKYGKFDCSYHYVADYDLMLRLYKQGCCFEFIEKILANYDENGRGNCYQSVQESLKLKRRYHLKNKFALLEIWLRNAVKHYFCIK